MTKLYLIAHKVRGEPAFDIASHMECPECGGNPHIRGGDFVGECHECDSLGYWWAIPTSGHRAYPYWTWDLSDIGISATDCWEDSQLLKDCVPPMPEGLPDHYTTRTEPKRDLVALLGLIHRPLAPIKRRL